MSSASKSNVPLSGMTEFLRSQASQEPGVLGALLGEIHDTTEDEGTVLEYSAAGGAGRIKEILTSEESVKVVASSEEVMHKWLRINEVPIASAVELVRVCEKDDKGSVSITAQMAIDSVVGNYGLDVAKTDLQSVVTSSADVSHRVTDLTELVEQMLPHMDALKLIKEETEKNSQARLDAKKVVACLAPFLTFNGVSGEALEHVLQKIDYVVLSRSMSLASDHVAKTKLMFQAMTEANAR